MVFSFAYISNIYEFSIKSNSSKKDKLIKGLGNKLDEYKVFIDDVFEEDENNNHYLRVVVDADFVIDSDLIYEVSSVIDKTLDELDLIKNSYILDIYKKEKGETNE